LLFLCQIRVSIRCCISKRGRSRKLVNTTKTVRLTNNLDGLVVVSSCFMIMELVSLICVYVRYLKMLEEKNDDFLGYYIIQGTCASVFGYS